MNTENINKELDETIDPESIVFEEEQNTNMKDDQTNEQDDDSEMPAPETKNYDNNKYVSCTEKFMELFNESVKRFPFTTILKNQQGAQIKLIDLVKYVENNRNKISIDEMNKIISFIANSEFGYVRPLMEVIEDKSRLKELWTLVE